MIAATTRIVPIKPENRVQSVRKLQCGGLRVTLASGQAYTVSKDDEMFQAFIVYTMLADL